MDDKSMEWYDSDIWYDLPEWYEEENAKLMEKFLNEEEHDRIDVFIKKHASDRYIRWSNNYRIQKQKDRERGKIVN